MLNCHSAFGIVSLQRRAGLYAFRLWTANPWEALQGPKRISFAGLARPPEGYISFGESFGRPSKARDELPLKGRARPQKGILWGASQRKESERKRLRVRGRERERERARE